MIWTPVALSRLPVGSSARMTAGSLASARAMATRCCCPPESSIGRWLEALAQADQLGQFLRARAALAARPSPGSTAAARCSPARSAAGSG